MDTASVQGNRSNAAVEGVEDALEMREGTVSNEVDAAAVDGSKRSLTDGDRATASFQKVSRLVLFRDSDVDRRRDILPATTLLGCGERKAAGDGLETVRGKEEP